MTTKRVFQDPDFGPIQVPDDKFPSKDEWAARKGKLAQVLKASRLWPKDSVHRCPNCEMKALVGRDDLVEEIVRPGQIQMFRHLEGAKCTACNAQYLEPAEVVEIEGEVGVGMVADYEAKVSNIGSGTLGTYWPKDIVRNMGLTPDKKAYIQVLDRDTALVRFSRGTRKVKVAKAAPEKAPHPERREQPKTSGSKPRPEPSPHGKVRPGRMSA